MTMATAPAWNQFDTGGRDGMTAEVIDLKGHNGDTINAYYVRPAGTGPFPGIVLVHHLPGWDEFYREMTRRFAQHGFVAICPNLYSRYGQGSPELQQKLAAVKQSVAENQQKLHQYQWTETTQLTLNSDAKPPSQSMCLYGPNGTVQKTPMGPPPAPGPACWQKVPQPCLRLFLFLRLATLIRRMVAELGSNAFEK